MVAETELFELLVDFYQTIKVRSETEIKEMSEEKYIEEKSLLKEQNGSTIINYIREHVEMLAQLSKENEKQPEMNDSDQMEKQLQIAEEDIRTFLKERYEDQIFREALEERLEEVEEELKGTKVKLKETKRMADRYRDKSKIQDTELKKLRLLKEENEKLKLEVVKLQDSLKKKALEGPKTDRLMVRRLRKNQSVDQPSFADISGGDSSIRLNIVEKDRALGKKVTKLNPLPNKTQRNASNLSGLSSRCTLLSS